MTENAPNTSDLVTLLSALNREDMREMVCDAITKTLREHETIAKQIKEESHLKAAHPEGCIASSYSALFLQLAPLLDKNANMDEVIRSLEETAKTIDVKTLEDSMFSHSLNGLLGALQTSAIATDPHYWEKRLVSGEANADGKPIGDGKSPMKWAEKLEKMGALPYSRHPERGGG